METLPSGVVIRDFHDPIAMRSEVFRRVREQYLKKFPIENGQVRIDLLGAEYDPRKMHFSLEDHENAILTGGRLVTPLKGKFRLTDKVTGQPIEEKELTFANVPYVTDEGTTVYGGTTYVSSNQSRLKPGIYARRKDNGELESHVAVKAGTGPQMRLFMEPDTGIYRIQANKANIKLYPVLRNLGVTDEQLEPAWGKQILQANQAAWDKQAFGKFYDRFMRSRARPEATDDERKAEILAQMQKAEFDPEVNQRHLGKPHANLSTDALIDASHKLLKINRNEEHEDDRDHPANRTFHSMDDFLADRVAQDAGKLGRTLLYRATYDKSLKHLRPGYFTPQLEGLIISNQLTQPVPGINPVEVFDQQKRVIQLGEGGISCFSADTDVLSKDGWKPWPTVTENDRLACRIDGVLEFHPPNKLFSGQYSGEMFGVRTDRVDYLVTRNHRFWVTNPRYNRHTDISSWSPYHFREAWDIHGKKVRHFIAAGPFAGGSSEPFHIIPEAPVHKKNRGSARRGLLSVPLLDWVEFLGYFLADGSVVWSDVRKEYRVEIGKVGLANPEERDLIISCLDRLGFRYRYERGMKFRIQGKHLAHHLKQFGKSPDKFVPDYVMNGSSEVRHRFYRAITTMDIASVTEFSMMYSSVSERLRDQVSLLAIMEGWAVTYYKRQKIALPGNPSFQVLIQSRDQVGVVLQKKRGQYFTQRYDGMVYCASVPGELLFVRRNGKTFWSGNSMESIPMSSRSVHPGQLGFVDPIRSSESGAIGVDQRFSHVARKGSDNQVYFPVRNVKTDKVEYVNPVQLHGKVLAFPQAPSLEPHRTFPVGYPTAPLPKMARQAVSIETLQAVKAMSDARNWAAKTQKIRELVDYAPHEWAVDSEDRGIVGLTHVPTGFQFHLPRQNVPLHLLAPKTLKAADLLDFSPDALKENVVDFSSKKSRPIPGMKSGKLSYIHPHEADYEMISPSHMFTDTTHLVPMSSAMKGARTFIASKYFVQALPLVNGEVPLVDTLDEETGKSFSRTMGHRLGTKKSDVDGVVEKVTDRQIEVRGKDGKIVRHDLKRFFPSNRKTHATEVPMVQSGDVVRAGQPLAHSNYTDKEGRLAMGKNLHVAFMPAPGGASFEDAIVVSDTAAKKLTSQHLYGYDVEHKNGVASEKAKFLSLFPNQYTNDQLAKIDANGMVRKGAQLEPGDPMLLSFAPRTLSSKDAALGNLHKVLRNSYQDLSQKWEKATPGTVTHAVEHRGGLRVNVATNIPLQTGDKISGRAGAKGVVSQIIPSEQMHRTKDGDPIDIIINPAALIGRVNPAMVFEALLGKIAHKHGRTYRLPAFAKESFRDYVESELKAHGMSDTEELEDPHTGNKVTGVLTGRQFFQKLEHISSDKISGRGEGGQDINMQPTRGGSEGAKKLGSLQMTALLSHGVPGVIRDVHLYRGSGNVDMWRRFKLGQPLEAPKVPFIYNKFLNSLRAAGIRVDEKKDSTHIMALTDKDVDKMAPHEVQNSETIDYKSGHPVPGGLMDYALHGGPEQNQWSHIKLDHAVPSPMMEEPVRRLLGLTEKQLREVMAGRQGIGGVRGPDALSTALKGLNLDRMEQHASDQIRSGRKTKRDEAVRQLHFISGMKRAGLEPSDLMISKVPVIPPTYRPITRLGKMLLTSDANYLYKDLMTARDAHRANAKELPDDELGDEKLAIYDAIKAVQGLGDPINAETAAKGVKGFVRQIAGVGGPKTGMFASKVIGHPVNAVGRAVAIPDANLNMDQVGIPEQMAWSAFGPHAMRAMVQQGMPAAQAADIIDRQTPFAKRYLQDAMDRNHVMYSRDPALHRFSIMGGKPVLVSGDAIRTSPLVVQPYNLDYDGDQLNVHVPISDDAQKEVREKMLPSQNLLSIKGKKAHYGISQEFILGLNGATTPRKGAVMRFPTREAAMEAYAKHLIPIDQSIQIG